MEKFGIFELLDALSAITENVPPPAQPAQNEQTAPPAPSKKVPDAAFDSPDYGNERPAPQPDGGNAYDGFLAKHDAIKKRATRNGR